MPLSIRPSPLNAGWDGAARHPYLAQAYVFAYFVFLRVLGGFTRV